MGSFKEFYKNELYKQLEDIPNSILSKYVFLECVKSTDSSTTYLIEHKVLKTKNILKIYKNSNQANEYKILSKYSHIGIPKIYDVIVYNDRTIIIEEFFAGKTFDNLIKESNNFTEKRLLKIFINICEILKFLHKQNPPVIHKDIKPENIIVNINDDVKLIDFGSSRIFKEDKLTDTTLLGTHGYAAPEQYGFSQTDGRTDIYSLGVMIDQTSKEFDIKFSEKFKKIILKCKEIDPNNRFNSVDEIINKVKEINMPFYKKKNNIIGGILLISMIIGGLFLNYNILNSNIYKFQSELIGEAVSIKLNKDINKITGDDLKNITEITIWGENIVENNETVVWESIPSNYVSAIIIDGIRHTKRGNIETLSDLKNMDNLSSLTLVKQKIKDLAPLKNLNIVHLFLNDNDIEDISILNNMTSLYTLELGGNPISDFSGISNLINLAELDISNTKCKDFSFLKNMISIKILIAKNLKLDNIEFLNQLYNLETLNLQYNKINNITYIESLNKLEYINLGNNPISDIYSINKMKRLKYIVIKNTLIDEESINNKIEIKED